MELTIFDKNNSRRIYQNNVRTVNFNRQRCAISFSNVLREEHDYGKNTVILGRDEQGNKVNWYVCFDAGERGYELKEWKNDKKGAQGYYFICSHIVNNILNDSTKSEKSSTFLVSEKPVVMDGLKWFKIILSNPIRVK